MKAPPCGCPDNIQDALVPAVFTKYPSAPSALSTNILGLYTGNDDDLGIMAQPL